MSHYATLKENFSLNIAVPQRPTVFTYKDNPLSVEAIIDSNVAGIDKSTPNTIKSDKYTNPSQNEAYKYVYQSCCGIITPKSPEYIETKQVIFSP